MSNVILAQMYVQKKCLSPKLDQLKFFSCIKKFSESKSLAHLETL